MKIGISCYPTYGGSGVVATELGKCLAEEGHEIHFISYAMPTRLSSFLSNIFYHEVEVGTYPLFDFPLYSLALASKMVEVAKYYEVNLFHVHYAIPHATSAYLAKEILKSDNKSPIDVKIITTLHGTDITLVGLEPSFMHTVKFSIEKSDGVTAVSNYLKEKTISNYKINKDIEVIPNFVDTEKYKRISNDCTIRLKNQIAPGGEKIIAHTSNFRPVKRVKDVIRIFEQINKQVPSRLLMIGDGPERSECERLALELNIFDSIRFVGKQDSLVEFLSISDLFLLPSQTESFGLAALEAMSCGVPVISTSIGGIPEINIHAETGYIAEIGDIERMVRYGIELLTNEKKYFLFSKNARLQALKYDEKKIVPLYESFYEKVLNQK